MAFFSHVYRSEFWKPDDKWFFQLILIFLLYTCNIKVKKSMDFLVWVGKSRSTLCYETPGKYLEDWASTTRTTIFSIVRLNKSGISMDHRGFSVWKCSFETSFAIQFFVRALKIVVDGSTKRFATFDTREARSMPWKAFWSNSLRLKYLEKR